MKKALSLVIALVLVCAMVLPLSAAELWEADQGNVAFGVKKATSAFNPDGVKSDGEYYDIALQSSWISYTSGNDDGIAATQAISDVNVAMSYDDTYLYTWVSYTDPNGHLFTLADHSGFWNGDIIQFSGAEAGGVGDERLEIGIGLYSDTNEYGTVNWYDYLASGYWAADTMDPGDAKITVNGNSTIYEFRVPFAAFSEVAPAVGAQYRVCYCFCWSSSDDYGTYAVWQLASGVSGGKSAENHALITLEDAPVVYTYPGSGIAPASGALLNAGIIGNAEGWGGNAAAGAAAAFDGNPTTFFDPLNVGDGFCGVDAGGTYTLTEVHILPRDGQLPRYEGATIRGSNDGENWTDLYVSPAAATAQEWQVITEFQNNTGYRYYSYFNTTQHGDVADVEFYGVPASGEAPAAEPEVAAPVVTAPAAQTADILAVAALVAVISLAGVAVSKKR